MSLDHVKPLKVESIGEGGNQDDTVPTEVNPLEDYIDLKGVSFGGNDNQFIDIDSTTGEMRFKDTTNGIHLMHEFLNAGLGVTNIDGGSANSIYGGITTSPIDGGNASSF